VGRAHCTHVGGKIPAFGCGWSRSRLHNRGSVFVRLISEAGDQLLDGYTGIAQNPSEGTEGDFIM
jgi:hypothetical protein